MDKCLIGAIAKPQNDLESPFLSVLLH
ncbi:hypothetical protein H1P_6420004 [Hyella patelloides LEGE 07179]|uniref:Uncharacterized protein n=1 Tax=Hyella patelloides LEGE 07179 TaxID=945734 RepID=A0A563W249_9CYAN|nr:hypothetical protein H1P_6420004 [Hyella patelloides LEGE 07179]